MQKTTRSITKIIMAVAIVFGATTASQAQSAKMAFQHVMNIGSRGKGEGQFLYVEDFDLSVSGQHILATDAAHAYVQVFDKTTGQFIARFGAKGDDDANLEKPEGISVAPNGDIFVADYTTGEVKVYDKNYSWVRTFSEYGSDPGQTIKSEFSDIYNGRYYLPEAGNHRISVWTLQGKFLFTFGSLGQGDGQLNNPESAKFSNEGKMYVADLNNDRIQVFDENGIFLFKWGTSGSRSGEFLAPAGIAIDKNNNIYVTEIGNNRVQVFDKDGNFITEWGGDGNGDGEFSNLHGIYCDQETGWIYVADTGNNRIQVFKPILG